MGSILIQFWWFEFHMNFVESKQNREQINELKHLTSENNEICMVDSFFSLDLYSFDRCFVMVLVVGEFGLCAVFFSFDDLNP